MWGVYPKGPTRARAPPICPLPICQLRLPADNAARDLGAARSPSTPCPCPAAALRPSCRRSGLQAAGRQPAGSGEWGTWQGGQLEEQEGDRCHGGPGLFLQEESTELIVSFPGRYISVALTRRGPTGGGRLQEAGGGGRLGLGSLQAGASEPLQAWAHKPCRFRLENSPRLHCSAAWATGKTSPPPLTRCSSPVNTPRDPDYGLLRKVGRGFKSSFKYF